MPTDGGWGYNWTPQELQRMREDAKRRKQRRAAKWQRIKDDFAKARGRS